MKITPGIVAAIHYKVATADGEHIDASQPGQPLTFLCGVSQIISGLEEALIGKVAGDKVVVDIPVEKAYGVRDPALDLVVPLSAFPEKARGQLKPGMQFQAEHPQKAGEALMFIVHSQRGDEVMVSGNHPLADKALHFEVEIASVRAATAEEVQHGHSHGAGGHQH